MKEYAKQPQSVSRTLPCNPKTVKQASISEILQRTEKSTFQPDEFSPSIQLTKLDGITIIDKTRRIKKKKISRKRKKRKERNDRKKREIIEAARKAYPEYSHPFPKHMEMFEILKKGTSFEGPEAETIQNGIEEEIEKIKKRHIETLANPLHDLYNLKTLIEYQQKYEEQLEADLIMDNHRTMGVELEFSYYEGVDLGSHTELAKSTDTILRTVPGEWVLETDSDQKLEIGVPPILVKDDPDGKANASVIDSQRNIIRSALKEARDNCTPKKKGEIKRFVEQEMPDVGLGKNWTWSKPDAEDLAFTDSSDKPKQVGKDPYGMYEQINLTLQPDEIAEAMLKLREKEKEELEPRSYDWLYTLYDAINESLSESLEISVSSPTIVLLSKAIASMGAIPSVMVRNAGIEEGEYSTVKELFGIWTKDNAANIVASAATKEKITAEQINSIDLGELNKLVLTAINDEKNESTKAILKNVLQYMPYRQNKTYRETIEKLETGFEYDSENKTTSFKGEIISEEIKGLFSKIIRILNEENFLPNPGGYKFGNEPFGGDHAGAGVRKETYVNVKSSSRNLHLAEVRSGWSIRRYLDGLKG